MAKSKTVNASVPSEYEPAEVPMHTAVEHEPQIEDPRLDMSDELKTVLANANHNYLESTMNETATPHSNPDPRKNSLVQNVHISNTQMRLEAENAILRATVDQIDRKIAELQAERTDAMGAIAMNNAALNAGEKL